MSGLANFFSLYMPLVDTWQMFDNSAAAGPRLIAEGKLSAEPALLDQESWHRLMEIAR